MKSADPSGQPAQPKLVLALLVSTVTVAAFVHALDLASRLAQNSDSAQSFVAGKAIIDGNALLSGWRLPVDSFYLTDTLPYAVVEWFLGPRPFLMVLLPAMVYALLVLSISLACVHRLQPIVLKMDAIAAVAFLVGSPVWVGISDPLLLSDIHVATVLGALLALGLCAWISEVNESYTVRLLGAGTALVVVSGATLASDPLSLIFAFAPGLVVLAAETRHGSPNVRLALMLLAGGIALGLLLPVIIGWGGGFVAVNYNPMGITASNFARTLLALFLGALTFFGANPLLYHGGTGTLTFLVFRAIAFGLAVLAAGYVLIHGFRKRQVPVFDRLLIAGAVSLVGACAVSTKFDVLYTLQSISNGGPTVRYVLPVVLIFMVLAGRQIPGMFEDFSNRYVRTIARYALWLCAALAVTAGDWRGAASEPARGWLESGPAAEVTRWLKKHGMVQGVGEYWSANLITAVSGESVRVRSVIPLNGRLRPYVWAADRRWYKPAPQFVIWQQPSRTGVVAAQVRETYSVCRIVVVASYHVAVLDAHRQGRPPQCRDVLD